MGRIMPYVLMPSRILLAVTTLSSTARRNAHHNACFAYRGIGSIKNRKLDETWFALSASHCSSRHPSLRWSRKALVSFLSSSPLNQRIDKKSTREVKGEKIRDADVGISSKRGKQTSATGRAKVMLRADRVLSNRGIGSRSEVQKLIKGRRVSIILNQGNDEVIASSSSSPQPEGEDFELVIRSPSEKIHREAVFLVDGEVVPPTPLLLAYHKPKGVLSAMKDDGMGRSNLGQVLDDRYVKAGMHPVGRLDYDTSGLILFSRDGELTHRLLHPRHSIEKEYVATVEGRVDPCDLRQKLKEGVSTAEGTHRAELLDVREIENDSQVVDLTDVKLVVSEGKHRMVRRMLANVKHPVVELRRERHGAIQLKDLNVGEFRILSKEELEWAEQLLEDQ